MGGELISPKAPDAVGQRINKMRALVGYTERVRFYFQNILWFNPKEKKVGIDQHIKQTAERVKALEFANGTSLPQNTYVDGLNRAKGQYIEIQMQWNKKKHLCRLFFRQYITKTCKPVKYRDKLAIFNSFLYSCTLISALTSPYLFVVSGCTCDTCDQVLGCITF